MVEPTESESKVGTYSRFFTDHFSLGFSAYQMQSPPVPAWSCNGVNNAVAVAITSSLRPLLSLPSGGSFLPVAMHPQTALLDFD